LNVKSICGALLGLMLSTSSIGQTAKDSVVAPKNKFQIKVIPCDCDSNQYDSIAIAFSPYLNLREEWHSMHALSPFTHAYVQYVNQAFDPLTAIRLEGSDHVKEWNVLHF